MKLHNAALAVVSLALMTGNFAAAQDAQQTDVKKNIEQRKPDYSPYPNQNFPNRVYWGVAHVHTGYSFDSGLFRVTLTPDDQKRFGIKMPDYVPMTVTDRAYTSPIWYTP